MSAAAVSKIRFISVSWFSLACLLTAHWRRCSRIDTLSLAVPVFGRLAPLARLVTPRQTFVRCRHGGGNRPCLGGSRMSNRSSSALNSEQSLASSRWREGGLSRLVVAPPRKRRRAGGASCWACGTNAGADRRPGRTTECAKSNQALAERSQIDQSFQWPVVA
jgi:hypothetical protein